MSRTTLRDLISLATSAPLALYGPKVDDLRAFIERRQDEGLRLTPAERAAAIAAAAAPGGSGAWTPDLRRERESRIAADLGLARDARAQPERPYDIVDGVALVGVYGTLHKGRVGELDASLGLCSTTALRAAIAQALDDGEVRSVLLVVDCPGGSVDGTASLARWIYQQRGRKPMGAYCDGQATSGGYWLAAAVDPGRLWAHDLAIVASIGVYLIVRSYAEQDAERGVRSYVVRSGAMKDALNPDEPKTPEQLAEVQAIVDGIARAFFADVAEFRGVDPAAVEALEGGAFLANDARVDFLVDGLGPIELAAAEMAAAALEATI